MSDAESKSSGEAADQNLNGQVALWRDVLVMTVCALPSVSADEEVLGARPTLGVPGCWYWSGRSTVMSGLLLP